MKPASKLSVGDEVFDRHGHATTVTWCQVHQKEHRLLVDLHTNRSMLTVTGCHRVVLPDGGHIDAEHLNKSDVVATDSSGCEKLQRVTRRYGYLQVVELEFKDDATVPVYVPTILTKGAIPGSQSNEFKCKDEPMVDDSASADSTRVDGSLTQVGACFDSRDSAQCPAWPDTDDDF